MHSETSVLWSGGRHARVCVFVFAAVTWIRRWLPVVLHSVAAMVSATVLRIFNLICYAGFLALLILGPLGLFDGVTTADVSNDYPTPLTPATYTFGIWFAIMATLGIFCIYQFWLDEDKLQRIWFFLGIALLSSGAWTVAWSYKIFWLTVVLALIPVVAMALVRVYDAYGYPLRKFMQPRVAWAFFCCGFTCIWDDEDDTCPPKRKGGRVYEERTGATVLCELFFVELPLAMYTAWSVIASALTIFVAAEADANTVSQATGVLIAIFIAALAVLDLMLASNIFYGATTVWAAIGIYVEQRAAYAVPVAAMIIVIALGALVVFVAILRFVYYIMRDSIHKYQRLSSVSTGKN